MPLIGKNLGHPAVYPIGLPSFFIKLFAPRNGVVLDPFGGSGQTGIAALQLGRNSVLIDNNKKYCELAVQRLKIAAKNISANIIFDETNQSFNVIRLNAPMRHVGESGDAELEE